MMTGAEIHAALQAELGSNLSPLLPVEGTTTRWFNEAQSRLQTYKHTLVDVSWTEGDVFVAYPSTLVAVVEILYPEDALEKRWTAIQGGLLIEDYQGAREDGSAKLIARTYWDDVETAVASELGRDGDAACLIYCLYRFYRYLAADRSVYQRYATMMNENGVSIDDLGDLADDHYRDFLDARADLPLEPAALFYPEG